MVKRTNLQFGNRMFKVAGLAEWSSLPDVQKQSENQPLNLKPIGFQSLVTTL